MAGERVFVSATPYKQENVIAKTIYNICTMKNNHSELCSYNVYYDYKIVSSTSN